MLHPSFSEVLKRMRERRSAKEKRKALRKAKKFWYWFKSRLVPVSVGAFRLKAAYSKENFEAAKKILDETPSAEQIIVKAMREENRKISKATGIKKAEIF